MAFEFKNLNTVEMQEQPTENTTVMAFEDGVPKQIPANAVGVRPLVVELLESDITQDESSGFIIVSKNYDKIYETYLNGGNVVLKTVDFAMTLPFISIALGQGMIAATVNGNLLFPNGSYHGETTTTASLDQLESTEEINQE